MPKERKRNTTLTFRTSDTNKERLEALIPDPAAKVEWLNELLEYGMDQVEAELRKSG